MTDFATSSLLLSRHLDKNVVFVQARNGVNKLEESAHANVRLLFKITGYNLKNTQICRLDSVN